VGGGGGSECVFINEQRRRYGDILHCTGIDWITPFAWYDPSQCADIEFDDNDSLEIIEFDELLLTKNPNLLTATSLVAFVGIWLKWHNPGNYPLHAQLSLIAQKFQRVPGY